MLTLEAILLVALCYPLTIKGPWLDAVRGLESEGTPPRLMLSKGVHIGRDVWLGTNVCVLDGVTIGSGAIVSPNSVVSMDLPERAIAQGNPAKVVFTRR